MLMDMQAIRVQDKNDDVLNKMTHDDRHVLNRMKTNFEKKRLTYNVITSLLESRSAKQKQEKKVRGNFT